MNEFMGRESPVTNKLQYAGSETPSPGSRLCARAHSTQGSRRAIWVRFSLSLSLALDQHHHHPITIDHLSLSNNRAAGLVASCPANHTRSLPPTALSMAICRRIDHQAQ